MPPKAMPAPMPPTAASAPAPSATPMRCSPRRRRRELRAALERVGGRLRRLADHRWQCGGRHRTTRPASIAGTAVGADYLFSPHTIAGFALAGGGTNFSVAQRSRQRPVRSVPGRRLVAPHHGRGLYLGRTGLWLAGHHHQPHRDAGRHSISCSAQFNANAFSGRVEGGYRFVAPWVGGIGITPYAAAQFTTFDLPAYAEQALVGTNDFALAYGAKSVTDPRSELGFRTDKSFAMPDGVLTLRGRLAWAHDYDPDRSIGATFQTLPGAASSSTARRRLRLGADHSVHRKEMAQRLVGRRDVRRRVLQRHAQLRRQGRGAIRVVSYSPRHPKLTRHALPVRPPATFETICG